MAEVIDPITGLTVSDGGKKRYGIQAVDWLPSAESIAHEIPVSGIAEADIFPDGKRKEDVGLTYAEIADNPDIVAQRRHERQSGIAQFGNMIMQTALDAIAGQTIAGTGYLLDIPMAARALSGTEKRFGNWLSDIGNSLSTWTKEQFPIYEDPEKRGEVNLGDWSYWMANAPSIASTLSLVIPTGAALKGLSALGKAVKADKLFLNAAKAINSTRLVEAGKLAEIGANDLKWAAKGITQAVMSRHAENLMEANSVHTELQQLAGLPLSDEQAAKIKKEYGIEVPDIQLPNGEFVKALSQEAADEIAAKAAANTYKANWAMVLQDMPQYLLLNRGFGKATKALSFKAARELGESGVGAVAKGLAVASLDNLGEGAEEMYQYVVSERAKELELARAGLVEERDLPTALQEYTKSGDFITSGIMGALGAGAMRGLVNAANSISAKVKGFATSDEQRVNNIRNWSAQLQQYNDALITAEKAGDAKSFESIKKDLGTDIALEAAKNGNLGHFMQMINGVANSTEEEQNALDIDKETVTSIMDKVPYFEDMVNKIEKSYDYFINKYDGSPELAAGAAKADYNISRFTDELKAATTTIDNNISTFSANSELSSKGLSSLQYKAELAVVDKRISQFTPLLENEDASPSEKESYTDYLNKLNTYKEELQNKINELNYTEEERAADGKAFSAMQPSVKNEALLNINTASADKVDSRLRRDKAVDTANNYDNPTWVKEQQIKAKNIAKKRVKEAVEAAETAQDVQDVIDRAETPEDKKTVKKVVKDAAETQEFVTPKSNLSKIVAEINGEEEPSAEEESVSEDVPDLETGPAISSEILAEQQRLNQLSENQATTRSIQQVIDAQKELNTSARYTGRNGAALYHKELGTIEAKLDMLSEEFDLPADKLLIKSNVDKFLTNLSVLGPTEFARRVGLLIEDALLVDNKGADYHPYVAKRILEVINGVHVDAEKSASTSKAATTFQTTQDNTVTPSDGTDATVVVSTDVKQDNRPYSITRDTDYKGDYLKIINGVATSGNVLVPNMFKDTYTGDPRLNDLDIPYGSTVYIEYIPNTPSVTAEHPDVNNGWYTLVVYKDNIVTPENRMVIGSLNTAVQKNLSANERKVLTQLRTLLAEEFNEQRVNEIHKSGKESGVQSVYTLSTVGFKTYFSKGPRNTPLDVLPASTNSGEYAERGGFILGYVDNKTGLEGGGTVRFDGTSDDIPTISGLDSKSGEIIIGVPNPAVNETLILRAFKPELREVANDYPEMVDTFVDTIIATYKGLVNIKEKAQAFKYLKRLVIIDESGLKTISTFNSKDLESETVLNDFREILLSSYIAFNKDEINRTDVIFDPAFGVGSEPQVYNKVINKFLRVTLEKDKMFRDTQVFVSLDFKDSSGKSVMKPAEVSKQIISHAKEVIKDKQFEEVSQQVDKQVVLATEPLVSVEPVVEPTKEEPVEQSAEVAPKLPTFKKRVNVDISDKIRKVRTKLSDELVTPGVGKSEINWLKKHFPDLSVEDVEEIKDVIDEVTHGGKEAWGAFYNSAVYLSKNAGAGTVYHEAFHAIYSLGLSAKERNSLLADAIGATELEKEEWLADKFAEYYLTEMMDKSLSARIKRFFRKLRILINSVIGKDVKTLEDLATRADFNYYSKSVRTGNRFYNPNEPKLKRVDGWSYSRELQAIDTLNNILVTAIINGKGGYRESKPEFQFLTDAEIMDAVVTHYGDNTILYQDVYNAIVEQYDSVDNYGNPLLDEETRAAQYDLLIHMFTNEGKPMQLVVNAMKALTTHGILVSNKSVSNIEDVEEILDEDSNNDTGTGEDTSDKTRYGVSFVNKSSKFGASQRIKAAIRYLETDEVNLFGFPKYINYDVTYNTLLRELAGAITIEDIRVKLKELAKTKPEFNVLLDKMNVPAFATDMVVAFGRAHMNYFILNNVSEYRVDRYGNPEKNISTIFFNATRSGVTASIIDNWASGVAFNSDVVKRTTDGKDVVNTVLAAELVEQYMKIVNGPVRGEEQFLELSNIMSQFGMEISPTVFRDIEAEKPRVRSSFYIGVKSLKRILDQFVAGNNPFNIEDTLEGGESASIKLVANRVKKSSPELFENSIVDSNGNKMYTQVIPTYLTTMMNKLSTQEGVVNVYNTHAQDAMYKDNAILTYLMSVAGNSATLRDSFEAGVFAGFNNGSVTKQYKEMSEDDLNSVSMGAYWNNGNATYSYFRTNVVSDSGNMIMYKFKRLTQEEVYAGVLKQAEHEYNRILKLQDPNFKGNDVTNLNHATNKSTETGYYLSQMFNGFEGNPMSKYDEAMQVIDNYYNELADSYYNDLIDGGIFSVKDGKIIPNDTTPSQFFTKIGSTEEALRAYIKGYVMNDHYLRGQMGMLLAGDPAFYKESDEGKVVDYTKRFKEMFSPKQIPDINAVYEYTDKKTGKVETVKVDKEYRSVYLKDVEKASNSMREEVIDGLVKDGLISPQKALEFKVAYLTGRKGNNKPVNTTDAQAYITLPFYRNTMISFGRWTDAHQDAYGRLLKGVGTGNDIALVMQPIKPFMYTKVYDAELGMMVPIQHKNSEFLLLPQLVKNNPTLMALHHFMLSKNIGTVNFESSIKAGLSGATTVEDIIANPDGIVIHTIPTIDRGIQQDNPEHYSDTMNLFGTQIRKLIIADLKKGVDYVVNNGKSEPITMKAQQLISLYERIIEQNLKDAFEEVNSEFYEDGKINWKKIHNLLLREGLSRGKGEEFEKAIAYDAVNDRLALPLFDLLQQKGMEALLTSIFRNNITKQKISGAALMLATSYGLSEDLKLVFNNEESRKIYEKELEESRKNVIFGADNKSNLLWKANEEALTTAYKGLTLEDFRKLTIEEQERLIACNK